MPYPITAEDTTELFAKPSPPYDAADIVGYADFQTPTPIIGEPLSDERELTTKVPLGLGAVIVREAATAAQTPQVTAPKDKPVDAKHTVAEPVTSAAPEAADVTGSSGDVPGEPPIDRPPTLEGEKDPYRAEIAKVHSNLHNRLLCEPFRGDAHYGSVVLPGGEIIDFNDHQETTPTTQYGRGWPEHNAPVTTTPQNPNTAGRARDMLREHSSTITVHVPTGITPYDVQSYITTRPCDISPDDGMLGSYLWGILHEKAPEVQPTSTDPVIMRMGEVSELLGESSAKVVRDLRSVPLLWELYKLVATEEAE